MSNLSSPLERRRRIWHAFWLAVAAIPVVYLASRVIAGSQNIAFWDEFDAVLAFVLRLEAGMGWREWVHRLFALDSEHRTVTSRIIFTILYGLTGRVNFNVISVIGNVSLVAACVLLIVAVKSYARRMRLGVLLAFAMFHLGHYETFFWSGASIDHHLVLTLVAGAIIALTGTSRAALVTAIILAGFATFTLAHGCLIWPVGGAMLVTARRWRDLRAWGLVGIVSLALFFYGYAIHPTHQVHDLSVGGLIRLFSYWMALLGSPLSFGATQSGVWFGLGLVVLVGLLLLGGAWKREPVIMPFTLFCVGALGLIAVGRIELAGEHIQSRYVIVASLAWGLTGFLLVERWADAERPFRSLAWALPVFAFFNVAANLQAGDDTASFLWSREYAALKFAQYGDDNHAGPFRLYPREGTARQMLERAAARGIYEMPDLCPPTVTPELEINPDLLTQVNNLATSERSVAFDGWAAQPGRTSQPGQIRVLLRSDRSTLVFATVSVDRKEIAGILKEPRWRYSGYHFVVQRRNLPPENFQVGLLIGDDYQAELKMTDTWINLAPAGNMAQASPDRPQPAMR